MPLFDFKCNTCKYEKELICSFEASELEIPCTETIGTANSDINAIVCGSTCPGKLIKQASAPGGFGFNGLGCYHNEKHLK